MGCICSQPENQNASESNSQGDLKSVLDASQNPVQEDDRHSVLVARLDEPPFAVTVQNFLDSIPQRPIEPPYDPSGKQAWNRCKSGLCEKPNKLAENIPAAVVIQHIRETYSRNIRRLEPEVCMADEIMEFGFEFPVGLAVIPVKDILQIVADYLAGNFKIWIPEIRKSKIEFYKDFVERMYAIEDITKLPEEAITYVKRFCTLSYPDRPSREVATPTSVKQNHILLIGAHLLFNRNRYAECLAALNEYMGHYDQAIVDYNTALKASTSPDDTQNINNWLTRTYAKIADRQKQATKLSPTDVTALAKEVVAHLNVISAKELVAHLKSPSVTV